MMKFLKEHWMYAIVIIVAVLFMSNAEASLKKICQEESNVAFILAYNRDHGLSREKALAEARADKDIPYENKYIARHNINLIYDNPGLYPEIFGRIIYNQCMGVD